MTRPSVVLVGGGHAHLRVLRDAIEEPWSVDLVLVSPSRRQFYSSMVPGYLQGTYSERQIHLDLASLCGRAGAKFVEQAALTVDGERRVVRTVAGEHRFDLASVDVGSVPSGLDLPGVRQHALGLRPMGRVLEMRDRLDALARASPNVRAVVVGAGAAGFEVALAIHRRIADMGRAPAVALFERGAFILPGYADGVRRRAMRLLEERGIRVATEASVVEVDASGVTLSRGLRVEADTVVWATGAAPPPLLASSNLPLSSDGYFAVDPALRAIDGTPVWGAGDCVDFGGRDLPRAGVYAVRQGPVLARNLRAAARGAEPEAYEPQEGFLSLLNTADGKALLRWKGVVSHSRPAWWLKDAIDRRFLASFRA